MPKIIAYTYEADYHCVPCAQKRFAAPGKSAKRDECGIPYLQLDNDKNPVHPVFDIDELPTDLADSEGGYSVMTCGDCNYVIAKRHSSLEEACNHD